MIPEQNGREGEPLRTAVVGVGSLGRHHARNYADLTSEGTAKLSAVCDIDETAGRSIADQFDTSFTADWRTLTDSIDAVSIVAPTELHCEIACGFLEKGVHCLVEKPIAKTLDEADKMISAANASGAKLMVGHLERFNPAMAALKPHVTTPLYFEIHRVSPFPNRSLDVDVVLDVMIHDLDAVQWLVGEDVEADSVSAVGIPIISDKVDAANARLEFANGAVANITASRVGTEKIRKTRFYQTNSYVVLDYVTKFASVTSLDPSAAHPLLGISVNKLEVTEVEPLRAELEAFLKSAREGSEPPVTAEDGRRALVLALQVLEKIETHRARLRL
ncbi:MAG: gfo/Idh/MocA family oxidoreductase [Acidobacteria bacterium]|nr:MAG: gfo/Idh/MocA family oxidoreductase [Acidobacteriota bacterium]REK02445.1 MAG: gfo/Idh/MocA family oxidoreductase [Acidobacteriota bacterium]REK13754.1 MAG: gfo/Idh/MocA family oxidoreductase [Acidobacteriota bacterium]REK41748.1 MAG: gfo/Idh/MocA family oxidoreductase [Acidobacteriota bacterium]